MVESILLNKDKNLHAAVFLFSSSFAAGSMLYCLFDLGFH